MSVFYILVVDLWTDVFWVRSRVGPMFSTLGPWTDASDVRSLRSLLSQSVPAMLPRLAHVMAVTRGSPSVGLVLKTSFRDQVLLVGNSDL